jgi:hypothetical protein
MPRRPLATACRAVPAAALLTAGCWAFRAPRPVPRPALVPHAAWEAHPPLGHPADAVRRNLPPAGALAFHDLAVTVLGTATDSAAARSAGADSADGVRADSAAAPVDVVRLRLARGDRQEERTVAEGAAFNWEGFHVAVVAVRGAGELGAGLVALEVATVASLPPEVAAATTAGGAAMRLRVPHRITHVTLHHTGDARPLAPGEDARLRLRNLQTWGARDRNWWDVPYHVLLDLDGRLYQGRDWRFTGETNTTYDPGGHFLISVIGNYDQQEPTPAQLAAIADLMAWALREFDVPPERIGGHYHYAGTGCPGRHLRQRLEDGTLRRMVEARLRGAGGRRAG